MATPPPFPRLARSPRAESLGFGARRAMLRGLLECVHHLHEKGMVHADIKPLNHLRLPDGA